MKKPQDPRHLNREQAVRALFSIPFQKKITNSVNPLFNKVIKKIKIIDKYISAAAPEWPISKINRIDLAILRLGVWELAVDVDKKVPEKVVIDEAVELAKTFGTESSPGFVNGVLGTILKNMK